VASVTVNGGAASITVGSSIALSATARDAEGAIIAGRAVAWASSNLAAATVSATGVVSALAVGSTTISATIDGVSGTAALSVIAPVASISLSRAAVTLGVGGSVSIAAAPLDADGNALSGRAISWSSSAPNVATVSGNGVVTGLATGSTTVTAMCEGKAASAPITVAAPVATITLAPNPAGVVMGKAGYFEVTLRDASGTALTGRAITWSSSAPAVASVSADGLVSGLSPGTATITASSEGKSGSATVVVSAPTGSSICAQIAGAAVVGSDGVYLGRLSNKFDSESIYNEFGKYGSQYSATSIYNQYGKYGSPYSNQSAFNQFASAPPVLVKNGVTLAYFTVNTFKNPYVTPGYAASCTY
jgi:uncharacterized protein YjdB